MDCFIMSCLFGKSDGWLGTLRSWFCPTGAGIVEYFTKDIHGIKNSTRLISAKLIAPEVWFL